MNDQIKAAQIDVRRMPRRISRWGARIRTVHLHDSTSLTYPVTYGWHYATTRRRAIRKAERTLAALMAERDMDAATETIVVPPTETVRIAPRFEGSADQVFHLKFKPPSEALDKHCR